MPQEETEQNTNTILVAEVFNELRRLIKTTLDNAGYQVLEARTAEEALSIAHAHHGVLDLLLANLDHLQLRGRQLAQVLRQLTPDLKVIYLADPPLNCPTDLALHEDCIQKPFLPEALMGKVRHALP